MTMSKVEHPAMRVTQLRQNQMLKTDTMQYTIDSRRGGNALSLRSYHFVGFYLVSDGYYQFSPIRTDGYRSIVFVSGSFFPSIPSISKDMNTSPSVVR